MHNTNPSLINTDQLQHYQRLADGVRKYPAVFGKLLSLLHDIRKRRRDGGPPCDRCFGPAAECVCGPTKKTVERCGRCAGPGAECVCFYGGGDECSTCFKTAGCACKPGKCPCDACVGCGTRVARNRQDLADFIDSVLGADVSPAARPAMVSVIDSLLQAVDGRLARLDQVRASIARKMFGRIMRRVCGLLERIHCLHCEDDGDWGRIFVLLHDLRDVFVHSRVPGAVVHREFGRMCAAVCDALAIDEPERWLGIPPCQRQQALCGLRNSVARGLAGVDLSSFLGDWGQQRVGEVVGVMLRRVM